MVIKTRFDIDAQFERIHDIQQVPPDMTSYACTLNHIECAVRVINESRRQVKRIPPTRTYTPAAGKSTTLAAHSPLYVWPPSGRAGFQVVSNEKMSLVAFWTGTAATAITAVVRTTTVAEHTHEDTMSVAKIVWKLLYFGMVQCECHALE